MKKVTQKDLEKLYIPPSDSHKGQNGRLLVIGGSHLFHSASLWALEVASRIVDLVHYSSVEENNRIVHELKKVFRNGIVVPRDEIESYIEEDDVVLIGPGMVRAEGDISKIDYTIKNLKEINEIEHEGMVTYHLTKFLLKKYPKKQWVIDAGALQMVDPELIPEKAILTPHHGEFKSLRQKILNSKLQILNKSQIQNKENTDENQVFELAKALKCVILLKGQKDIAAGSDGEVKVVEGGNAGMTKGGTGDVLAGLIAALACKNDPFLATISGSFINKKAGDELFQKMGPFFNTSDLARQIPITMKNMFLEK
ncbi:NAD(P)H-hydrate dehydratase [Patescibacteria group bacterium]